ncbi:MAG: (d)CMP kinase, partial [Treponema sp.]|nr:(d)CMP kinase [Treponema sp.]
MVIAIDGPAGSGKSTIARLLAENLKSQDGKSFTYINSGNLYRAICLGCIRKGIDPADPEKTLEYAKNASIEYRDKSVILDREDVTHLLHTDEIDRNTAPLSAIVPVRHVVNSLIRRIAGDRNAVVEGRDMTTVVFPNAEYRFYLDASADARARRRYDEGVSNLSLEEIREAILKRDEIDRNKQEGSLVAAPGVVYLDTSDLTVNQVYDKLIEKIQIEGHSMVQKEVGSDTNLKEGQEVSKPQTPSENIQTQLQEEYLKNLEQLEEGQLVDGSVIQVTTDQVFINIGYKSEGKIPI